MFEFTTKVVNRGWFRFEAEDVKGSFIYKTTNPDEIRALKDAGFKDITPKTKKKSDS